MRYLLDTHALVWSISNRGMLSPKVKQALSEDDVVDAVSVASAWEIAIKVGKGNWPEAADLINNFEDRIEASGFEIRPITVSHVRRAGLMQSPHRDPFDRLLAAQAEIEGLILVTSDIKLAGLGALVLW